MGWDSYGFYDSTKAHADTIHDATMSQKATIS